MKNIKLLFILFVVIALTSCNKAGEVSNQQDPNNAAGSVNTEAEAGQLNTVQIPEATPEPTPEPTSEPTPEPIVIDYEVVKPNEIGLVMVIMYHQIVEEEKNAYQRSVEGFKSDLQKLYDQGFRTISMTDLMTNNVNIEAGFSPVVISFDDGYSSAFSLVDIDGSLTPTENCAVDILTKFSEEHPDFGRNMIFYINETTEPFRGAGSLEERFRYLIDNGYEIGNHTYSHEHMDTLDMEGIQEQIGKVHKLVLDTIGYEIKSLAYPYGQRPSEGLRELALNGEYDGVVYNYHSAVRVGQSGGSSAPNNVKYDAFNIPRVQGSDIENTDLGWFLRNYENGSSDKYVSDGLPNRISVPEGKKESVNMESIGDKELYLY